MPDIARQLEAMAGRALDLFLADLAAKPYDPDQMAEVHAQALSHLQAAAIARAVGALLEGQRLYVIYDEAGSVAAPN